MSNPAHSVGKLGEYKIIKVIAEGTFGIVKMARHTITGHIVAMKYLSKALILKTKTKLRVQREIEYMRALRHPHIIKLYEVISTPTDIIIVLEYASGELFRYIQDNGRMPEHRARRFFQQLISGIEYSHGLKIIHRDLKPENVLLDNDLNVKIADFGLSNEISDGDFMKTSCGSPNYAAPEVIRAALYTGPEIDVWSCGVILYVTLCGCLPFEDDDVPRLFERICHGHFHMPSHLSPEARSLISAMLAVDPVKRITVPQITKHPFFTRDLPRYLTPLPPSPGPILGPLSSLVAPPKKVVEFDMVEGIGRIEEDIVDDLASRMIGSDKTEIWAALKRDDGPHGNAVKVAYTLMRDMSRMGRTLEEFEEQERDALLAARDPRNAVPPAALAPVGEPVVTQFEAEFDAQAAGVSLAAIVADEGGGSDVLDFEPGSEADIELYDEEQNNFTILDSSLPPQRPEPHHLASYVTAKRNIAGREHHRERDRGAHKPKWHFGIRSRSPPMEVMLEIYKTLKTLGMEWKEKKDLGGLGGVPRRVNYHSPRNGHGSGIERARELDGHGEVDLRAASGIYFVETRARVQDVVVLMNLQLYNIDSINYLVDFHHKKSYRASTEPGAGKFDMASPHDVETMSISSAGGTSPDGRASFDGKDDEVVSPFIFMDVACRLILELAGGSTA